MPIELTSAALLVVVAFLCAALVARGRSTVVVPAGAAAGVPSAEEWRSAALRHFHEHKDLQRTVAEALSTPGAVSGQSRRDLMVALGAPRVDVFA